MNKLKTLALLALPLLSHSAVANSVQWLAGPNGHYYAYVAATNGVTWSQANAAANGMTGPAAGSAVHLATISSAEENSFIVGILPEEAYVSPRFGGDIWGPWLGGYQDIQDSAYAEPGHAWKWVTGEAWDFTNWAYGEPNDDFGGIGSVENYLQLHQKHWQDRSLGTWNDLPDAPQSIGLSPESTVTGYVIEASPVPIPGAIALFPLGLAALGFTARRRAS